MKPNLWFNLRAFLHILRRCVLLDLCFILSDNTLSEKKSTDTVFLGNLIYNNNSSRIIHLDLRSGHYSRVKMKNIERKLSCPLRHGELRPMKGVWI